MTFVGKGVQKKKVAGCSILVAMDLRLVEIFCRVYKTRSFSQAAEELRLTQPTVSAHIKELEAAVGASLFNRLGREIEPTEAGRFLYEHSRSILTLKRNLVEKMDRFLKRVEGELVVGASSVPGEYILPGMVTGFQAEHPGVRARLHISDSEATIEDLRQGKIQLGMVGATADDEDLTFNPFLSDELVLAASRHCPAGARRSISIQELQNLPLLLREPGSGTRMGFEHALAEHGLALDQFKASAELDNVAAIKQAVKEGHGVSFLSRLTVASEVAVGTLRAVRVRGLGPIHRTYYTAVSRRRVLSPLAQAFLNYLDLRRQTVRLRKSSSSTSARQR